MDNKIIELNYDQDEYRTPAYWEKFYFYKMDTLIDKLKELVHNDWLKMNNILPKKSYLTEWQYWITDEGHEDTYFEISYIDVN